MPWILSQHNPDLAEILRAFPTSPNTRSYMILECETDTQFTWLDLEVACQPQWFSGVVFSGVGEVRWLRAGDGLTVVQLFDTHPNPSGALLLSPPTDSTFLTHGLKVAGCPGVWSEGRIPRQFQYPADPEASSVQITVSEYHQEVEGHFWRFKAVVPEPPGDTIVKEGRE